MTTTDPSRRPRPSRPVSIGHLVAGLILTALSALWFVHELSDWRLPEPAIWGPVLLIVAGFIGLVVSLGNTRRSRDDGAVSPTPTDPGPVDPGPADPGPADPALADLDGGTTGSAPTEHTGE